MVAPDAAPTGAHHPTARSEPAATEVGSGGVGVAGAELDAFRGRLRSLQAIASVVNSDLDLSRIVQTIVAAICRHTS